MLADRLFDLLFLQSVPTDLQKRQKHSQQVCPSVWSWEGSIQGLNINIIWSFHDRPELLLSAPV